MFLGKAAPQEFKIKRGKNGDSILSKDLPVRRQDVDRVKCQVVYNTDWSDWCKCHLNKPIVYSENIMLKCQTRMYSFDLKKVLHSKNHKN